MTTYILQGGNTKAVSANTNLFFKQFTDSVPKEHVTILLCYFAREKGKWSKLFERDKTRICEQSTKSIDVQMVNSPENLPTQLQKADVLYVGGGEEHNLRPYVAHLSFLKDALKNKVYIGSSMGAFLVSRHYVLSFVRQDMSRVYDGLGLIPYNTLCHWNIETHKDKKTAMLHEKDPQTPLLLIEEQKFKTVIL